MSTAAGAPLPTSARQVLDVVLTVPEGAAEPVKLFVAGGIGTGKSTALEWVRRTLRAAGCTVASQVCGALDLAGAAVVIDDAHLLDDAELHRLTQLAEDPGRAVVVAAEPREHQPALRSLRRVLEREHPRIILGPLSSGEISHVLADASGHPPTPELLATASAAAAGIPFLVSAIATAPRPLSTGTARRAAAFALAERLRQLDQAELETLVIATLGTDLGAADLAAALDRPDGADLIDRARGTGLIQPSRTAEFVRAVHRAAAQLVGATRHQELERRILRKQLQSETLLPQLAVELAEHGVRDENLALWLRDNCRHGDPATRMRIQRAAVAAGATEARAALADALALATETPAAAELAEELLLSGDSGDRATGTRVAASISAQQGCYAHAAELFNWLGPYPDAAVASAGAIVHCANGDLNSARAAMHAQHVGVPTAAARAVRELAEGILMTVDGPYPAAAARLGQSLAGGRPASGAMPDSAPALVSLAALHSGDAVRARSVIGRAVDRCEPVFAVRHRLLQGWMRMQDGQLATATADADAVSSSGLSGRDALWAVALRAAIARRSGDAGALQVHWATALDLLAEYSVDLFSLLPLGELWVAGARLRQADRLAAAVERGFAVLDALGRPTVWSPSLHWAGVHAGILANDPSAVAPHGQALTAMAAHGPFPAALAAAGRTWLRALAGHVDADEVIQAARGLAQFGLTSDATRLTSQAALRARDTRIAGLMLQTARDLKSSAGDPGVPAGAPDRPSRPAVTTLSDREREVAELLVLGTPYRDIGAQLFISAKTVEHHVARIRRRLAAQSRPEMLSMLRAMLADDSPTP